ncbi:hypothetical protein EV693_10231 [Nicoletella semolina]|uniref:Uncharacterized protein n=1 Tax=Nicoletella semolina TaxID=271160 RepID=A0A4R2NBD9_9PAST|nr:hypothetical protein [Nicoletella semolina]TCP18354.1 hypothetical protein EV693_10231 [Nicoletella semolina]
MVRAKNGDTITLAQPSFVIGYGNGGYLGSINEQTARGKLYTFDKDITIDLNGNELIFRGVTVINEGSLTLKNGTISIMDEGNSVGNIFNDGTLTITGSATERNNGSKLTAAEFINNGTYNRTAPQPPLPQETPVANKAPEELKQREARQV